jgi:hypothetical protein
MTHIVLVHPSSYPTSSSDIAREPLPIRLIARRSLSFWYGGSYCQTDLHRYLQVPG